MSTAGTTTAPEDKPKRIGIILVHGIGEQRRYQHLDSQARDLLHALRNDPLVDQVTVDIGSGTTAAFQAEQDSWPAGPLPGVTIVVRHRLNGGATPREDRLMLHEVWWADVNERYSLAKQIRFWLWGLAVWTHPGKLHSGLPTANRVAPPRKRPHRHLWWDRMRLFFTGMFFALLGFSIGWITFLAGRLLNLQPPNLLRTLANYISAVKLYNQPHRYGPNLFGSQEDFLDTIDEPPRVSIRRRMIRAIADVACNDYDRWYVLAHSQGSIVAFNGLMETAYAWPGYLDEERWQRLRDADKAGERVLPLSTPTDGEAMMPRRPAWAGPNEIAYRSRIFEKLHGFLTYGSPLEKFAGLWPALVPIAREKAFRPGIPWINLFDPVDPVSGQLLSFRDQPSVCCPKPTDYGYAAGWVLLLAHLQYLTRRAPAVATDAATATTRWLLTDSTAEFIQGNTGGRLGSWFLPGSPQHRFRSTIAWMSWLAATAILALLGALTLPMLFDVVHAALTGMAHEIAGTGS